MTEESTTPDLEGAVRRSIEAYNRRDFDGAISVWAPDAVWELAPLGIGAIEARPLIGREAIRKFWEDIAGAFEEVEVAHEEHHDLGSGVTFGVIVLRGRPHGSGGLVETPRGGIVATWRDGRIARATSYTDIDEARAAAERLARERG
jgi:ketosteroid isomerase-like protein